MITPTGVINEPCDRTFWQFLPFYSLQQLNCGRDQSGEMLLYICILCIVRQTVYDDGKRILAIHEDPLPEKEDEYGICSTGKRGLRSILFPIRSEPEFMMISPLISVNLNSTILLRKRKRKTNEKFSCINRGGGVYFFCKMSEGFEQASSVTINHNLI